MVEAEKVQAQVFKYNFEVEISRSAEVVWPAMVEQINEWWMSDFRVLGADSVISLSDQPGGMLLEKGANGEFLEWYRVQMCQPGKVLYLVGHLAPDWGGPTTSMLKLALAGDGSRCVLSVSDGLSGNVSEASAKSAEDGWRSMFGDSFKRYAER